MYSSVDMSTKQKFLCPRQERTYSQPVNNLGRVALLLLDRATFQILHHFEFIRGIIEPTLTMNENGSLECCPVLNYDWVIKDFLKWSEAIKSNKLYKSPQFAVKDLQFGLGCFANKAFNPDKFSIFLVNYSKQAITLSWFSLLLVCNFTNSLHAVFTY